VDNISTINNSIFSQSLQVQETGWFFKFWGILYVVFVNNLCYPLKRKKLRAKLSGSI